MGIVYADLGVYFEGMTTGSNLRSFLESVTPIVRTYTIAKQSGHRENTGVGVRFFHLADLWNQFYEWSACGAGTPVCLPSGETITQYFVPYLSAIQLYTNGDFAPQRDDPNWHGGNWIDEHGYDRRSMAPNWIDQRSTPPPSNSRELCFRYFEHDSPYERMPLADKVYELSHNCPALTSLDSTQLSPSSWMSIFWYPIGHVPMKSQKDLSTCFLTYHGLAISDGPVPLHSEDPLHHSMAIAPFGLSTHKMEEAVWISGNAGDQELADSLFDSAQSWLKRNGIRHYDFNYFLHNRVLTGDQYRRGRASAA